MIAHITPPRSGVPGIAGGLNVTALYRFCIPELYTGTVYRFCIPGRLYTGSHVMTIYRDRISGLHSAYWDIMILFWLIE